MKPKDTTKVRAELAAAMNANRQQARLIDKTKPESNQTPQQRREYLNLVIAQAINELIDLDKAPSKHIPFNSRSIG